MIVGMGRDERYDYHLGDIMQVDVPDEVAERWAAILTLYELVQEEMHEYYQAKYLDPPGRFARG
jgi:hypothetical protein